MSWLVAAMAAGVLEGDILTGMKLATGAGEKIEGRRNTAKVKSRQSSILTTPSCGRQLSVRDLAGVEAGQGRLEAVGQDFVTSQSRRCQGEVALRRHFQISSAIGGIPSKTQSCRHAFLYCRA